MARTVRQRRVQLGLSQAAAAEQAGVVRRTWYEVELGHRRGSDGTLERIAAVLKMPPGSLHAIDAAERASGGEQRMPSELHAELVAMIHDLTAEEGTQLKRDLLRRRMERLGAELAAMDDEPSHAS